MLCARPVHWPQAGLSARHGGMMTLKERDAMIYNHLIDFMTDGMSRHDAEVETARQTGYSLRAVRSSIARHIANT